MQYGAAVVGAPDTLVRRVRRFSCSVTGNMHGRSAFARLQLSGFDVGKIMANDPIFFWADAVWDGFVDDKDLESAWVIGMREVALSKNPFAQVRGPAGATIASARRLG